MTPGEGGGWAWWTDAPETGKAGAGPSRLGGRPADSLHYLCISGFVFKGAQSLWFHIFRKLKVQKVGKGTESLIIDLKKIRNATAKVRM